MLDLSTKECRTFRTHRTFHTLFCLWRFSSSSGVFFWIRARNCAKDWNWYTNSSTSSHNHWSGNSNGTGWSAPIQKMKWHFIHEYATTTKVTSVDAQRMKWNYKVCSANKWTTYTFQRSQPSFSGNHNVFIISLTTVSISVWHQMAGWLWIITCQICAEKHSWAILRYYSSIYLEGWG